MPLPFSNLSHWALADWIEVRLLFGHDPSISLATLQDELLEEVTAADVADYDEGDEAELAVGEVSVVRRELRAEAAEGADSESLLAEETIAEIDRRSAFVGHLYPIRLENSVATLSVTSWREAPAYAFLVALNARYIWKLPADLQIGARLFERLVVRALHCYWGGEAVHFGWPRDPGEDAPFRSAFPRLVSKMNERLIVRPEELPISQKDLAVDAVAWRPLDDRPGQTVLLCQCSVGEDWADKGVPIEKWTRLINFAVTPTRGLAFPFLPEAVRALTSVDWLLLCAGVGVPFDRLRLIHLIGLTDVEEGLTDQLRAWTEGLAVALGNV